ncbi:MAG: hypothetical protein K2P52_08030 [Campylobacterales bacterium]|nr:hypothetical protein [Campylobacterales bacterium]
MADKCKIAEYLIHNAKAYINNTSITYGNVYENFDKDDPKLWRDFEEVENYITNKEAYNYNGNDIIPQYTVMLKTKILS